MAFLFQATNRHPPLSHSPADWPPAPGMELPPGKLCNSWHPEPWRAVRVVRVFVFRKGLG